MACIINHDIIDYWFSKIWFIGWAMPQRTHNVDYWFPNMVYRVNHYAPEGSQCMYNWLSICFIVTLCLNAWRELEKRDLDDKDGRKQYQARRDKETVIGHLLIREYRLLSLLVMSRVHNYKKRGECPTVE